MGNHVIRGCKWPIACRPIWIVSRVRCLPTGSPFDASRELHLLWGYTFARRGKAVGSLLLLYELSVPSEPLTWNIEHFGGAEPGYIAISVSLEAQ